MSSSGWRCDVHAACSCPCQSAVYGHTRAERGEIPRISPLSWAPEGAADGVLRASNRMSGTLTVKVPVAIDPVRSFVTT